MIVHPNFFEVEAAYRREMFREAQKQRLIKALRAGDRAARPTLWQRLRLSVNSHRSAPVNDYIPLSVVLEVTRR